MDAHAGKGNGAKTEHINFPSVACRGTFERARMTKNDMGQYPANNRNLPDKSVAAPFAKKAAIPHPGHTVQHGGVEGATGMLPGAGHPRGR